MSLIATFLEGNSEPKKTVESSDYLLLAGIVDYEHDMGVPGITCPLYSLDIILSHQTPNEFLAEDKHENSIEIIPLLTHRQDFSLDNLYGWFQLSEGHAEALLKYEAENMAENYPHLKKINGVYQGVFHRVNRDGIKIEADFGNLISD